MDLPRSNIRLVSASSIDGMNFPSSIDRMNIHCSNNMMIRMQLLPTHLEVEVEVKVKKRGRKS